MQRVTLEADYTSGAASSDDVRSLVKQEGSEQNKASPSIPEDKTIHEKEAVGVSPQPEPKQQEFDSAVDMEMRGAPVKDKSEQVATDMFTSVLS